MLYTSFQYIQKTQLTKVVVPWVSFYIFYNLSQNFYDYTEF